METVFFDIDTQFDFIDPAGKLYAQGAEKIIPKVKSLLDLATRHRYTTISSMDAHAADDPEFKQFPAHCVAGTPGQRRVLEHLPNLPRRIIPANARPAVVFESGIHYIVEKTTLYLFKNAWADALLKRGKLKNHQAIVFGVVTEYCVDYVVRPLLQAGLKTYVVTDAIAPIEASKGDQILGEWRKEGAHLLTTKEIFEFFRWLGHMPLIEGQEAMVGQPRPKYPGKAPRH